MEKATITLGSNAVFQVKPWQRREEKGFFRMLFGRMRAKIAGLVGNERFNVHSATATIGVKGTEEIILVNVQGDATVGVTENDVTLRGIKGGELNIPEGQASGVVGGRTPGSSFAIYTPVPRRTSHIIFVGGHPPGSTFPIGEDFEDLDSPDPTSDEGFQVPLGNLLVQNGIVSQEEVDDSESGASDGVELPGEGDGDPPPGQNILDEAAESAQDSANEASAITKPISVEFGN